MDSLIINLLMVLNSVMVNCVGATMTLNIYSSIIELLLLQLLRQLPIVSVALHLRSLKLSQLLWCRRDRCVRHYSVITMLAF